MCASLSMPWLVGGRCRSAAPPRSVWPQTGCRPCWRRSRRPGGQKLRSAGGPGDDWARAWLIEAGPTLTTRARQLAADLVRRKLNATRAGHPAREGLMASLVLALLAGGSYGEAARLAGRAL